VTDYEYIARRLARMADDALLEAQKATVKIEGEAMKAGAFGGSRMQLWVHETIKDQLKKAVVGMAAFTFAVSGGNSDQAANTLESGGLKFVDDVLQWLRNKYHGPGTQAFGGYLGPPLSTLDAALRDLVRQAVDDFCHGIAGDAPLKKDPLVNVVSQITNSPGAVQQTALGDHNHLSVQQQSSILRAIDELLASDEFKSLSDRQREGISDTADVIRDEFKKPDADPSKIRRWAHRLLELAKEFGMHVAASALTKVLLG
jgi:hypothetical protein